MGHYAQDLEPETDGSILEEALAAFGEVEALQHEMRELEHRMAEPGVDLDEIMDRYQKVQEAFDRHDGFTIRARAESILFALGFAPELLEKNVHELSGGQKSRVMLAKAILQGQDLLLLDEPTNHLDLPSLRWLEGFLNDTKATVAVISHDRYFLDQRRHQHPGDRAGPLPGLRGQLHRVHREEGAGAGDRRAPLRAPAGLHQEAGGIHPPQHRRAEHQDGPGPAHPPRRSCSAWRSPCRTAAR